MHYYLFCPEIPEGDFSLNPRYALCSFFSDLVFNRLDQLRRIPWTVDHFLDVIPHQLLMLESLLVLWI